jgi:NAD(P)-dependent dehydrogenase (short-subunit alcohol dehydrogenase family)
VTVQVMATSSDVVTRTLAIKYAKDGIRANIALGVSKTPMHKPETHESLKGLHAMGRKGEIKEVVEAIPFLTDATFATGEIFHVDSGMLAGKW